MDSSSELSPLSRRDFVKATGFTLGASALAGITLPHVHAQGSDQLRIALIGCGGRGTGAAVNAMAQVGAPKLVAMADVFQNKLDNSFKSLSAKFKDQVDAASGAFVKLTQTDSPVGVSLKRSY